MSHKHLTPNDRECIVSHLASGCSFTEIARLIGCHKSTISREVGRNGGRNGYSGIKAHAKYLHNRQQCCQPKKLCVDRPLYDTIEDGLKQYWSPEQIVGRHGLNVSVPTIYRAIRCGILPRSLTKQCLRYHGKDYKRIGEEKRGKLSGCTSIDLRPPEASNRRRTGDIEGDTIVGRQGTGIIVTLVDRKTRYLAAAKLEHKGAEGVAKAVTGLLSNIPCQSVTFDNGKEFACHRQMSEELGVPIYFAHPHSPWERGTNENTNKLLRQFLPKGSSFANVTDSMLSKFVNMLNNRPRKCLGYATPAEMMFSKQNVAFGLTI